MVFDASPDPVHTQRVMLAGNFLAYIDPGSGLLLWQMIVAAFVGILFYLKRTRDFILRLLRRLFKRD
jgi:hypothetical protein